MKKISCIFLLIFAVLFESHACAAINKRLQRPTKVILVGDITSFEQYCYQAINKVREENGLQPLSWWPELAECAKGHSQNMANGRYAFGHEGFQKRARAMRKIAPVYFFGENVAYNYNFADPVQIAVEGWMESQGHRKNILENYEETGIGVAITEDGRFYITQLFSSRS